MHLISRVTVVATLLAAMSFGHALSSFAQEPTSSATPSATERESMFAYLFPGSCIAALGDFIQLPDVEFPESVAADDPNDAASPVGTSFSSVHDYSLDDLLAEDYAVAVQARELDPDASVPYLACGNVRGTPTADGYLFVGLDEIDASGYSGIARLDEDNGEARVLLFVSHNSSQHAVEPGSPALVDAISVWLKPVDPDFTVDPDDPYLYDEPMDSMLYITVGSFGVPMTEQLATNLYDGLLESLESEGSSLSEVDAPVYGFRSHALSGEANGNRADILWIVDDQYYYRLEVVSPDPGTSRMSVLLGIADTMFDPERWPDVAETIDRHLPGQLDGPNALLSHLPRPYQVPDEYQLAWQDVFVRP